MSSPSSYDPLKEYDVFMNFRGIDSRIGFANHLYNALVRENYKTFIDNQEVLERDQAIKTGLLETIENSRCSIVILSENYASSTSCLRELAKIVECMETSGQIVLPVFYLVEPSHVKKLRNPSYEREFAKYDSDLKYDFQEVQSWKDALATVCSLAGWNIEDEEDNEGKKIKDIIADVSRKLHVQDESSSEPSRQSQLPDVANLESKTDPSNPNIYFSNFLPGGKIPTWFTKTSPKPIITIKKDPNWCESSDSIGLALCVSLRANPSDISFSCEMNFGNNKWEKATLACCARQKRSDFIWLFYLARDNLPAEWLQSSYGELGVSFHDKTFHPDTSCGPCGYSLMYRNDIETWNQIASNNYIESDDTITRTSFTH